MQYQDAYTIGNLVAQSFSGAWTDWTWSILVLGMISFFIVALLHMISIAFNIPALRVWAKGEYMQVLATYIFFGALIWIVLLTWGISVSFVTDTFYASSLSLGQPQGLLFDPFTFVQAFLKQTMINCEIVIYRSLYTVNFIYKIFGGIKTETMGVEPVGGWYSTLYTSFFEYMMEDLSLLLMLHWLQIRLLSVMKYVAPLMIQLGLILRTFPMSRGTGGLLLAIGFGFFAVYPISLAFLVTLQAPGTSFCTDFSPPPMMDASALGDVTETSGVINAYYTAIGSETEVTSLLERARTFIPMFYLQAMFFPIVALIITFTFIRQTGAIFGSDLNEIGRGLVKLI